MSDDFGPWRNAPERGPSNLRFLVWIGLIAAGALGIWELSRLFPNALADASDQGYFMRLCVILVLVASGIVYSRRFTARETFRNIAIWGGLAMALAFGYTFYHRFEDAALDARARLVPGYATRVDADRIEFAENRDGDFTAIGSVNGVAVEFVVDTGADDIVLSPRDAQRAGVELSALHFNRLTETANGQGRGAAAMVDRLEIGPIRLFNVPVSINQAPMRSSLLGMTFLRRMRSFEMKDGKLVLRWR